MSYEKVKSITFNKDFTQCKICSTCNNDTMGYRTSGFFDINHILTGWIGGSLKIQHKNEKTCITDMLVDEFIKKFDRNSVWAMDYFFKKNKEDIDTKDLNETEAKIYKNFDELKKKYTKEKERFFEELENRIKAINNKEKYFLKLGNVYVYKVRKNGLATSGEIYPENEKFTKNKAIRYAKHYNKEYELIRAE